MKVSARTAWLAILAALVPGCVLTNPTQPYAGMPALRTETGAVARSAPAEPVQGPLTLSEAIRVALANNPGLSATARDVDVAAAQRDGAAGQRLPSVNAVGGYSHYLDSQRLLPAHANGETGVFSRNISSADLVLAMPLFTGGRITSEIRAADLLQQAAEHRLARTRDELIFNVSSVFYGILAQRKVIDSLEFSHKALQEHLKRVQDLIAAQKAAKVDELRVQVRLADLEQRLVSERNVLAVQARVLANLLGLGSGQEMKPAGELEMATAAAPTDEQALKQALADRPDYMAARAALEAQAKSVDAARAAQWPTVSLQADYGGRWAADPTDKPAGLDSSDDAGQVGVAVAIPIFEGGQIEARIRQERARLRAAQDRLLGLELQIRLDVEAALLNTGSAAQRVEATQKAIEQAKESLRIEREKYDLGKGTTTDVLDAQSAMLDSQTNYYRALSDYDVALAQLRLATGAQQ